MTTGSRTGTAIEAHALTRTFKVRRKGTVTAVDGITFTVGAGEAIGYIGANGAGKSTTIKMLTGILTPSSGTVRTLGLTPGRDRRRLAARIGVVFGQRSQLWWDLPLRESLRILAAIHRLPPAGWPARRDQLVERLELGHLLQTPVRQLSLGERMRGEVAAALLHEPELLVLDEPTIGLDVLSKERLRLFLAEEQARTGFTLLLTTHDMDDIERLCPRVLVVDHGQLVYDGDIPGLVSRVGAERVLVVDLERPTDLASVLAEHAPQARSIAVEGGGLRHRLGFVPGATSAALVVAAVVAHAPVRDLAIEEPDIEDVVRRLYLASGR
jgi:ABC-2 type transport system ATP-binding protein